jgi:hypothetical protein
MVVPDLARSNLGSKSHPNLDWGAIPMPTDPGGA